MRPLGELGASSMNMGMTEALCLPGNGATWHLRSHLGRQSSSTGHQGSFVKEGHLVQTRRMHKRLERKGSQSSPGAGGAGHRAMIGDRGTPPGWHTVWVSQAPALSAPTSRVLSA